MKLILGTYICAGEYGLLAVVNRCHVCDSIGRNMTSHTGETQKGAMCSLPVYTLGVGSGCLCLLSGYV